MKKKATVLGCLLLLGLAKAEEMDRNACLQQAIAAVERLNTVFVSRQLPPITFDVNHARITQPYDRFRKSAVLAIWASNTELQCLPTGDPISILRDVFKNNPLYPSEPIPLWTKERALTEAKGWVEAFLEGFPSNTGTPIVSYHCPALGMPPQYHDGQWRVIWPRIDSQGHEFGKDALNVMLMENRGLVSLYLNFFSQFEEVHGDLISKEEALAASRSSAEKLLKTDLVRPFLPPGLKLDFAEAELWVMNPNHILQCKTMEDMATSSEVAARLAWRVTYLFPASDADSRKHFLEIWIDAQDKKVLGGDFR
jgi:hypothetical protein